MKPESARSHSITWRAAVRFAALAVLLPMVLFAAAGRLDWPMAWVYLILHVGFTVLSRLVVLLRTPDLLAERAGSLKAKNAKPWDRLLSPIVGLLSPLVIWLIAGLDQRFHWSPEVSSSLQYTALVAVVIGYALGTWAMMVNRFFSGVVRIQEDRGHTVVTAGPYRWMRHPAYAGAILAYLAMAVMLASVWALIPAALAAGVIALRTVLEDRTLQAELPGYDAYALRARSMLIPGIW